MEVPAYVGNIANLARAVFLLLRGLPHDIRWESVGLAIATLYAIRISIFILLHMLTWV